MVCVVRDIDRALSNTLQRLGLPEVILKPEQRSVIVKFVCVCLPTRFWKSLSFQMLLFVLIVCWGECVAGGSVAVAVSPSSCSFLLMVDEVM